MLFAKYLPIFVALTTAQSTIQAVLHRLVYNKTLTVQGSDPTATTYAYNSCKPSSSSESLTQTLSSSTLTPAPITGEFSTTIPTELVPTPTTGPPNVGPTLTARPLFRRQSNDDDPWDYPDCLNYTFTQGNEFYEGHLMLHASTTEGVTCHWNGEMTTADFTCTGTMIGDLFSFNQGMETTTLKRDEIADMNLIGPVTVPAASTTAGPTASQSSGFAPAGPLPTGAVGFFGGVAAVFVAAVAL